MPLHEDSDSVVSGRGDGVVDDDVDDEVDDEVDDDRIAEAINIDSPQRDDCRVENQNQESQEQKDPESKGNDQHEEGSGVEGVRSSRQTSKPPPQYNPSTGGSYIQALRKKEKVHNIRITDILGSRTAEYSLDTGKVIARNIHNCEMRLLGKRRLMRRNICSRKD